MIGKSGHKEWDRVVMYIGRGNVISPGLFSRYVRPAEEVECNGYTFEPGELRKTDLDLFGKIPCYILERIKEQHEAVILYKLRHVDGKFVERIHGWILATKDHKFIDWYRMPTSPKGWKVLRFAIQFLCVDWETIHAR